MPKIFVIKILIIIITSPYFLLSQEVLINQLPQEINTNDSEINFIQINDSTAYYTVIHQNKNKIKSNIYTTSFVDGNWSKRKKNIYNANFFNTGNISFSDQEGSFFTICNDDMLECKIVYLEKNKTTNILDEHTVNNLENDTDHNEYSEETKELFDQDVNDEEDFEIPAFLRKQKF